MYGEFKELLTDDTPTPLLNYDRITHYADANLFHYLLNGCSVTGILHLVNKTPVDWYYKKQSTLEKFTYGSEFFSSRTCVEHIIYLRNNRWFFGIPIRQKNYMFGDNKYVVNSAIHPHAKLHKRNTAISFHRFREAIASKMVAFYHVYGGDKPSDIISNHWS